MNTSLMKSIHGRLSLGALAAALVLSGCSELYKSGDSGDAGVAPPPAGGTAVCGTYALGAIKKEACPSGQKGEKLSVCSDQGWMEASSCEADASGGGDLCVDKVVFARDIKPIIEQKCLGCHAAFADYPTAKNAAPAMAKRVSLTDSDPNRMPRFPNPALSEDEKALFNKWNLDGLIADLDDPACKPADGGDPLPNGTENMSLAYVEAAILTDLNLQASTTTRANTRYLVLTHKAKAGVSPTAMDNFQKAIDKGLNSVSTAPDLFKAVPIDSARTIYRLDLRDYELSAAEWNLVEDREPLNFESFTTAGLQIKSLTGTRKAWLHAENFVFTSQGGQDQAVYYDLLGIPNNEAVLRAQLGVDFAGSQQNDFQAKFLGFFGSPISLNKNRLVTRIPSRDGYFWQTFDTDTNFVATKNLFQFPLLAESGGTAIFTPDASEVIFTLPNKLQAYALYDAAGNRQNAAPLNVVQDNQTPFDSTITNAFSCNRCHNQGIIPAVDQVRAHVLQNGSSFTATDRAIVGALYRDAKENAATFAADNTRFGVALGTLGISSQAQDPMTYAMDALRRDQDLSSVASLFFMSADEFKLALNSSEIGREALGQLLTGGAVGFAQLTQILPQLIEDIRFGQDAFVGTNRNSPVAPAGAAGSVFQGIGEFFRNLLP